MRRHGVAKPDTSQMPKGNLEVWFKWFLKFLEGGQERKGRSTLALYKCPCGQKVRVGEKTWPGAVCAAWVSQGDNPVSCADGSTRTPRKLEPQPSSPCSLTSVSQAVECVATLSNRYVQYTQGRDSGMKPDPHACRTSRKG
jgi:hypothetical protein